MSEWNTDLPFAPVPMWVLELPISDRSVRLYALLAGLRDYSTNQASFGRKLLAKKLRCSDDSLDRAKAELEKHRAISVVRGEAQGGARPRNIYTVHRIPPGSRTGAATPDERVAAEERPSGTRTGAAMNEKKILNEKNTTTTGEQISMGGIDTQPKPERLVKSVARKTVTDEEYAMAEAVLAAYNATFQPKRAFQGKDWLKDIIGRLREHPDLDLDAHRFVIAKMHRNPWWTDSPTPAVIYGNGKVFDRALNFEEQAKTDDGFDAYA